MITRRCNLRCLHCGSSGEQMLREDMSTKELLGVLDELARCKIFHISISGGEPLMHPDFFVIVDGIMQRPLRWQLDTNATLVTEDIAERLQRLPRRPFLSVSLDGMTAQTQERIRGPGSYAKTLTGIIRLTAAGLRVRPFTVLSRINYRELPQIVNFIQSIGIKSLNITLPSSCGRAGQHAQEMTLRGEELREALEISLRIEADHPQVLTGPWAHMLSFYRSLKAGKLTARKGADGVYQNCGAVRTSLTIASDGTVVPCDMSYTCRAGNVRDQPLAEIWRNSSVFRSIRESRGMPLSQVPGCEECAWHHACQGPCPAGGYALTGIWPAAEPTCTTREIGRLFETETVAPTNRKVS
jgi:SynChlorMet cassette radical SAM/SPASM protein ScmE